MEMSKIGKLEVMHKVISRKKSISSISNLVVNAIDETYDYCFIAHANCLEDALSMKEKILMNLFKNKMYGIIKKTNGTIEP